MHVDTMAQRSVSELSQDFKAILEVSRNKVGVAKGELYAVL